MLEEANKRGGYDELVCSDIVSYLRSSNSRLDLIVAADVLVYLGDLEPLFGALPQSAGFVASVEVNGLMDGYKLQESKRYAHSRAYIEATLAQVGRYLLSWHECVLRQDRGQPVMGAVLVSGHK